MYGECYDRAISRWFKTISILRSVEDVLSDDPLDRLSTDRVDFLNRRLGPPNLLRLCLQHIQTPELSTDPRKAQQDHRRRLQNGDPELVE